MYRYLFIFKLSIAFLSIWLSYSPAIAYEFPPYQGLSLKINGKIAETYDNNVTFAKDNTEKIQQFTTAAVLGLDVNYEWKRRSMGLSGQMNRPISFKSTDVRNTSEQLALDFQNEFSEYDRIFLRDNYTHTQVPGSIERSSVFEECQELVDRIGMEAIRNDPRCVEFLEEFGRSQGRFNTYSNLFNINYSRDIGEKVNIGIGHSNEINRFSKDESLDSEQNIYNIKASYKFSSASTVSLSYYYAKTRYEDGNIISVDSIRGGIRRYLTKRLFFDGSIGMVYLPSSTNAAIEALVTGDIDEKSSTNIMYSKNVETSNDRGDIFRNWRVTGDYRRTLQEDLYSSISLFYGTGEFISSGQTNTLTGALISVSYNFWTHKRGAKVSGTLGYAYSNLDSTDETQGYDRSTITSGLTVSF